MRTLRFAIMCDRDKLSLYQINCIKKILELKYTSFELIIKNKSLNDSSKSRLSSVFLKIIRYYSKLLFVIYSKYIRKSPMMNKMDIGLFFRNIPVLECAPIRKGKHSNYFHENDIEEIKKKDLDFILRFGFGIVRGEILNSAKYGLWSFHHDDELKYRGAPPAFWEIYNNDNVTGSVLQRLTNRLDGGIILRKGYLGTNKASYGRNLNQVLSMSLIWPSQVCIDIYHGNDSYLLSPTSSSQAKIYYPPGNIQFLVFLIKIILNRIIYYSVRLFFAAKWDIGVIDKKLSFNNGPLELDDIEFLDIYPVNDTRFVADPFSVKINDIKTILFEDFDYKTQKGHISFLQLSEHNKIIDKGIAIKEDFHLSYPYIVRDNDDIYCIPESSMANKILLYKARAFPGDWKLESVLVENMPALDSSLFRYNGKWWLFCSSMKNNNSLYIYHSDDIKGPWVHHENNPVKTDVRSARPAGMIFEKNGIFYRPAQDSSKHYGWRITINKIIKLSEETFIEEQVGDINLKSEYALDGIHTISFSEDLIIIDTKKIVFSPKIFLCKAVNKLID